MKRDEDCKGCSWNFGRPTFPCPLCEDHDLWVDIPYHKSEDWKIHKLVSGVVQGLIAILIFLALDIDVKEILRNASLQ